MHFHIAKMILSPSLAQKRKVHTTCSHSHSQYDPFLSGTIKMPPGWNDSITLLTLKQESDKASLSRRSRNVLLLWFIFQKWCHETKNAKQSLFCWQQRSSGQSPQPSLSSSGGRNTATNVAFLPWGGFSHSPFLAVFHAGSRLRKLWYFLCGDLATVLESLRRTVVERLLPGCVLPGPTS